MAGNGLGRKALDKVEKILHALMERVSDEEIDKRLEELGDDRRTALVLEPIRYAIKALSCPKRDERPFDVIVLEQVPQVKALWGVYKDALAAGLPGKGEARVKYEVAEVATLHTEAYGVPQTRRRTILIARLAKHGAPRLPLPTHHIYNPHKPERGGPGDKKAMAQAGQTVLSVDGGQAQVRPWVTMGEVLDRKAPFQVRSNYGSGGDPKKRGIRTDLQPSFTVTGKVSRNAVQHANGTPHTPDRLTIPEAGILQTFPPNYPWWEVTGRSRWAMPYPRCSACTCWRQRCPSRSRRRRNYGRAGPRPTKRSAPASARRAVGFRTSAVPTVRSPRISPPPSLLRLFPPSDHRVREEVREVVHQHTHGRLGCRFLARAGRKHIP